MSGEKVARRAPDERLCWESTGAPARCPQGPQALGSNEASRLWTCGQRAVCLIFIECNRAWLPPGSIGLEHGVEDHDDPAHHCHQRDFFELASCKQPFIKLLEQRIE